MSELGVDPADLKLDILEFVQPYRPEWNRFGPLLPPWFVARVKALDPLIVFQFCPPSDYVEIELKQKGGADPIKFPNGMWLIGRRLRNTGMVFRRAVLILADEYGRPLPITPKLVEMIRFARDEVRRGGEGRKLEEAADCGYQEMVNAKSDEWREDARRRIAAKLSKWGQRVGHRVFVPEQITAAA